ncbi:hypothetical protein [Pseudomonas sichuanensis]|uniref:hypothetical protein n=1 Tax=Pseudomonas sichuanensis TaxID=2213015 RepID=UPI002ABB9E83|nr:hypothetical protein [Pseudomonas sichuanensis]MDZ4017079.1 hypothetical protein [Pseudomonas sichuanensis]
MEGPTRKGYREVYKNLGNTDAALSVGALLRPVLKADYWTIRSGEGYIEVAL